MFFLRCSRIAGNLSRGQTGIEGTVWVMPHLLPDVPTIDNLPTFPRLRRSNSVKPTTPTFLSLPDIPPPTKPVVYSPVPTMQTFRGAIMWNPASAQSGSLAVLLARVMRMERVDTITYYCLRCVVLFNAQ